MSKIKTVIVDDERLSADGMKVILNKLNEEVQVDKVFYVSSQALEYMKNNEVDMALVDINMPEINGLELIGEIKKIHPQMGVIIITGFGTLEYAKEAMKYGIRHFLQKPSSISEIDESVRKCIEDIRRDQLQELLRKRDRIESGIMGKQLENEGEKFVFSMLVYTDRNYQRLHPVLKEIFQKNDVTYAYGWIRNMTVYYMFTKYSRQILEELEGLELPDIISVEEDLTLEMAKEAFHLTELNAQFAFYQKTSHVVFGAVPIEENFQEQMQGMIRKIENNLKLNDFLKVKDTLEQFLQTCEETKPAPAELKKGFQKAAECILKRCPSGKNFEKIKEEIDQADSMEVLYEIAQTIISGMEVEKQDTLSGNKISADLNLLMEKYYGNSDLSLRWISKNHLFLNSEYMGKVYMKETGEKFTARLQEIRLRKAAEFLQQGYKLYEVAEMVGYESNPNYLARLFRERYGMTPLEYRKNCGY